MSILFFDLRGVPYDEAEEVRELLVSHQIEFYETHAGMFGVSLPAIWLYDPADLAKARPLFDAYQQQRTTTQKAHYQSLKAQGLQPGFWLHNLKNPMRFLSYSLILVLVIYVSTRLVMDISF